LRPGAERRPGAVRMGSLPVMVFKNIYRVV
jgi:hypothetical protein